MGNGKPVGMMVQRPTQQILALGNLGAVQMYPSMPVDSGWWDPNGEGLSVWAAYAPKGAASLAASYTDLSGNSHDAGVGVAPTWNGTDGWIFNGSSQYLTTGYLPAAWNTSSLLIQFSDVTAGSGTVWYLGRIKAAGSEFFGLSPQPLNVRHYYGNGNFVHVAGNLTNGNMAVVGNQGYLNGSADGGLIAASAAALPADAGGLFIGASNEDGSAARFIASYIQAVAVYDTALTAPQVLAVATAMAAL